MLITVGFAFFGEYLQNFVPGRSVSSLDLLSGVIGALLVQGGFGFFEVCRLGPHVGGHGRAVRVAIQAEGDVRARRGLDSGD